METSSEFSDAEQKLRAGLQRFSGRRLVAVQSGQGAERKTGWLHGGHYPLGTKNCEMLVQCASPCCAGLPPALHPAGCLFNGSEFERHAGCERHKRWSESIRVLGPEELEVQAAVGTDTGGAHAALQAAAAGAADPGTAQASDAAAGGGAQEQGQGSAMPDLARAAARALWAASAGKTLRVFLCNVSRLLEAQHTVVGRPIWVFWLAEDRWFRGRVESFRVEVSSARAGPGCMSWRHTVRYDDGDVEELHLGLEVVSLQRPPGWRPDPQPQPPEQEEAEGEEEAAEGEAAEGEAAEAEAAEAEAAEQGQEAGQAAAEQAAADPEEEAGEGEHEGRDEQAGGADGRSRHAAVAAVGATPRGTKRKRRSSSERLPTPPQEEASGAEQQDEPRLVQAGEGPAAEQLLPALAPATANLEHLTRALLTAAQQPGAADARLSRSLVWQFLRAWRRMAEGERQDHASMVREAARYGGPEALAELLRLGLDA
ncbi:hypothetical protein ABPG75_001448 [Micractinium tetrahymenae]